MSETNWGRRKYRTTNWKAYNAALKARGDLTIWLDKDMQWLLIRQALFVNLARAEVSKPLDGLKLNGIGTLQ